MLIFLINFLNIIHTFDEDNLFKTINEFRSGSDLQRLTYNISLADAAKIANEESKDVSNPQKHEYYCKNITTSIIDHVIGNGYSNILDVKEISDVVNDDNIDNLMQKWILDSMIKDKLLGEFDDIGININHTTTGKKYIMVILGQQMK